MLHCSFHAVFRNKADDDRKHGQKFLRRDTPLQRKRGKDPVSVTVTSDLTVSKADNRSFMSSPFQAVHSVRDRRDPILQDRDALSKPL